MLKLILLFISLECPISQNSIWCSGNPCTSCLQGYLHPNNLCLSTCATGETKIENQKRCSSPSITVLFDINFNKSIPFNANSISSFSHPSKLSFNNPQKLTPIGTKSRGLYFETTSFLQSDQNWIPAPHFRVYIISRAFKSGTLFKMSSGSRTVFEVSANSTYYLFSILLSVGDKNLTYNWASKNSGSWASFEFICDPNYNKTTLMLNSQKYDVSFGEFRAQMSDIVYTLGESNNKTFTGFIYSLFAQNRYDFYRYTSVPDNNCLYGQYLYNSICYNCNSECSTWPACERSSCNLCFSTSCSSCSGYGYDECTSCSTGSLPVCGLNFKCTSGSYFECASCNSGYELRDGLCLLPAYKYNPLLLQTPVIDVKFTKFGKYYDNFQTGSELEYYPPYDSPDVNDPIPCANRGLYFPVQQKSYLISQSFALNYETTIAYWFCVKNQATFINKASLIIKSQVRLSLKLASTEQPEYKTTPNIPDSSNIWRFRAHSLKVESNATVITHYSDTKILLVYSFQGLFLSDYYGPIGIGNYAGNGFEGFIYSFTLWQTCIDDFSAFLNPCGEQLSKSCFWNCTLSEFYASDLKICINSTTDSGLADIYSGKSGQCAQFNCTKCESYSSDANCLIEVKNPCYTGLAVVGDNKCCSSTCMDCDKYFYFKCSECIQGMYLAGIYCYKSCPLGFSISSSTCTKSTSLIINAKFDELTSVIKSSPFEINFSSGNLSLFYPKFSTFNPIPAINRGFYFNTNSFMNSTKFTLFYNFTLNLFIKVIKDGIVFTKNNLEFSNLTGTWSYIGISMPNLVLNNWSVLAIRVFTDLYGNLYCRVLVDQGTSNYVEQIYGNRLFIDDEQSLQLGSPKNGFEGFLYKLTLYNGDLTESFSSFQICELSTGCISDCPLSEVAVNGICKNCLSSCNSGCVRILDCNLCEDPKCLYCSNFSASCTECYPNLYVNKNKCLCNAGYYLSLEYSLSCSACHLDCLTCSGGLKTNCISCKENSLLQSDFSCKCLDHYYLINGTCTACSNLCKTCENQEDFCLTCQDNFDLVSNTCLCKSGYYLNDGNCLTCQANSELINNVCVCKSGYYLKDGDCLTCQDNFELVNNVCVCKSGFQLKDGNCLTCQDNFELIENVCVCKSGFYSNDGNCQKCSVDCKTCYNETHCSDCVQGAFLTSFFGCKCEGSKFLLNGTCQECYKYCLTCEEYGENKCLTCESDFKFDDTGRCQCQEGYFWDLSIEECTECSDFCLKCNAYNETGCDDCSSDCLFCKENSIYKEKNCECIPGYFELHDLCISCDSSCLTCTDKNYYSCTSCESFLMGGMCLNKCPLGYVDENKVCKLKSSTGSVFSFDFYDNSEEFIDSVNQLKAVKPNIKTLNSTAPIPAFDRGIYLNGENSSLVLENYENDDIIFSDQFFLTLWFNTLDKNGSLVTISSSNNIETIFSLSLSSSSIKLILNFRPFQFIYFSNQTIYSSQWAFVGLYVSHNSPTSLKILTNNHQEYITDISEIPFIEPYNSSYYIGYSNADSLYFKGFIKEIKLSRVFPTSLSSLYSSDCDTCSICESTKTCFNVCQISEYYDSSTLTCLPCSSDCVSGCRYKDTCGLCFDNSCLDCTDYNLGSCISCESGYELTRGACQKCEKTNYYNTQTKLCESCKGLCRTCSGEFKCLTCKENAKILGSSCICSLGYTLNESMCIRVYFSVKITISSENKATLLFSEPLKTSLTYDQIKVQVNEIEPDFEITMNEMSSFSIKCDFNNDISPNTYISISFIKEITSIKNSLLSNQSQTIKLFSTNNKYKEERIQKARQVAKQGSTTGATISLSLSILSMDFSSVFNFVSFSEIYSVISLYGLDLPEEILEFLRSVRVQNSIPNVFEKAIGIDDQLNRNPDFVKYGYKGNVFIVNSGVSILIFCGITFVFLIVKIISTLIAPRIQKFSIITEKFNINVFLNFWLQSSQEILITSSYGIAQRLFKGLFIFEFFICLVIIVTYI